MEFHIGLFLFSVIEGAIAQAVPEHPKRDNIFSVSTAFGDAYLFEVSVKTSFDADLHVQDFL